MAISQNTVAQRFRLRPHLALFSLADGRWVVRDGSVRQWIVQGPVWLGDLLGQLNRPCTTADLRDRVLAAASEEEIRQALNELVAEGVAEMASGGPSCRELEPGVEGLEAFLSRWSIGAAQIRHVRAACPIRVVGEGCLASGLRAALDGVGLVADRVGTIAGLETGADRPGLWVAVEDTPGMRDWRALDKWAIRHRQPWMCMSSDTDVGRIGPLFVPGETACWTCFQRRLDSNRSDPTFRLLPIPGERALPSRRGPIAGSLPPWVCDIVVGMAVAEVLRYLFGHEPCRCLGRLLCVDFRDYAVLSETVLPLPGCPSCAGARTSCSNHERVAEDVAHSVPAAGLERWCDLLVARRCGIIRGAREVPGRWDDPQVFVVSAEMANLEVLGGQAVSTGGGGGGLNADDAWGAAIGEAAERYCASLTADGQPVRTCAWADFEGCEAVDPADFALYSQEQYRLSGFPFSPFRRDCVTDWVPGRWLSRERRADSRSVWLPADLVYLGFTPCRKRSPLAVATSTGLAAGPTMEAAILSALCEVIERDAFVVAWWNGLSVPRVELTATQCKWLREVLEDRFLWPRIDYIVGDLTPDSGVPTYAVISRGPSEDGDIISFGAASHPDARTAVLKALIEAGMGRKYIRQELRRRPARSYRKDGSDVRTFEDHAQFYTRRPRDQRHLLALVNEDVPANLDRFDQPESTGAAAIGQILDRMEACGLRACWCDLTTPDVGLAGLHVVRVLVPGMQLLHGDHLLPFLGGERHRHPERVFSWHSPFSGWKRRNPWPHPYP